MSRRAIFSLIILGLTLAAASTALAGKGNGGKSSPVAASCTASGGLVQAKGLPTDQVINFMVTTAANTTGWVLGFTPDGTWSVYTPTTSGTTYQFVSKTSGVGGTRYDVFASCTA